MNNVHSGPIHIDNVACYGSEDKLIDCTYHTDTSEDTHAGDIWIDCSSSTATSAGQSSDQTHADNGKIDTAVIVAVIAAVIGLLALVIIIAYIICNKQGKIRRRLV